MITITIRSFLIENNPILKEKHNSKQYPYTKELIGFKVQNHLSQKEMAILGGLDYETYLEYEACYLNKSVEEYEDLLNKIRFNFNNKGTR